MKHQYAQFPIYTECGNIEGIEYVCGCGKFRTESFGEIQQHIKGD